MRERFVASHELRDSRKSAGGLIPKLDVSGKPSNFLSEETLSDFFSDFLPSAMVLQRQQGCLPSKVRTTASETERD